jgi:hypothetical protein
LFTFHVAHIARIAIGVSQRGRGGIGRRAGFKSNSKTFENHKNLANTSVFSHIFRQMI